MTKDLEVPGHSKKSSFNNIPCPTPRTTPMMKPIPYPPQTEDRGLKPDHSISVKNTVAFSSQ